MKPITLLFALCVIFVPACDQGESNSSFVASPEPSLQHYCVVSLVDESDPYFSAVAELQKHHQNAKVLTADAVMLDGLLDDLREAAPDFVAVVVKPDVLDVNLIRQFMRLATEIDDDPFLDFADGFITGDSADSAVALVKAGQISDQQTKPAIAMLGVAGGNVVRDRLDPP